LWLSDHCIDEVCVLPGAAYAEMALAAVMEASGAEDRQSWMIRELCLDQVMPVTDETVVATTLTGDESQARVEIRSRCGDSAWVTHAIATAERVLSPAGAPALAVDDAPVAELDPQDLYRRLRSAGQQHGPAFQGIVGLTVSDSGAACAQVRLPSAAKRGSRHLLLHPVMFDVAVQVLGATKLATDLAAGSAEDRTVVLPVRFAGIRLFGDVTEGARAVGSLTATDDPDRLVGRVVLTDSHGQSLLEIDEVEMMVLRAPGRADELTSRMFVLDWQPTILDKTAPDVGGAVLMVAEPGEEDALLSTLRSCLAGRTEAFQSVSARDEEALREAITRHDVPWDEIVVVFPPRDVDESLPE
jgi:phthiocerol/phenolphthiocerol synthesis type-I polyketide synthase C